MPCFRRVENRIVGNCSTTDVTEDLRHESYCQRAMLMNIICSVNKRWSSVKLLIHREYNMQKAVISKINKDPGSYEIFSGYVFFRKNIFRKNVDRRTARGFSAATELAAHKRQMPSSRQRHSDSSIELHQCQLRVFSGCTIRSSSTRLRHVMLLCVQGGREARLTPQLNSLKAPF